MTTATVTRPGLIEATAAVLELLDRQGQPLYPDDPRASDLHEAHAAAIEATAGEPLPVLVTPAAIALVEGFAAIGRARSPAAIEAAAEVAAQAITKAARSTINAATSTREARRAVSNYPDPDDQPHPSDARQLIGIARADLERLQQEQAHIVRQARREVWTEAAELADSNGADTVAVIARALAIGTDKQLAAMRDTTGPAIEAAAREIVTEYDGLA
jgi:hypothetical protein